MIKKITLTILVAGLMFVGACDQNQSTTTTAEPVIKKDAKPVADAEIAVIEMEDADAYGVIKLELYSNIAPKMVERFKELAKEGFYNGVSFHRINADMIQSGDPKSTDDNLADDGTGKSDKPNVPAEFSDLKFEPGILGAARGTEFDSANSQFFIMKSKQPGFDNRYTVFGKVIEGMNNVSTIGAAPRNGEKPNPKITIKQIRIETRK
jgi:cyclophilin family peptidyl-prolyl cis-trans isomerase